MANDLGVETHVSRVFFTDDRAIKIYKPLKTDVLDASTIEARRELCKREVTVNRRFAPHAYVGAATLSIGDAPYEYAVVMRRFADSDRLASRLRDDGAPQLVRDVARRVAVIHGEAPVLARGEAASVAGSRALASRAEDDLAGLAEHVEDVVDPGIVVRLSDLAAGYLTGRGALLDERISRGHVIDGHGDLLAEDIFLTESGPIILDALAFDDRLRWGDVLADLGFLTMDLQRLGHPDLARVLMQSYAEFTGERHPGSLAHFYVALRAIVRAKVTALRARQVGRDAEWKPVIDLVQIAADHLDRAQVRVLLVGGIPGSGKTAVASSIADAMGWVHLSSDEHRRDLGLLDRGNEAYDDAAKDAVYESLLRHARSLLGLGQSVVLDSAWDLDRRRAEARSLATDTGARLHEVQCVVPVEVARQRVASRTGSLSEATTEVVDLLADAFETWSDAQLLDTTATLDDAVGQLMGRLPNRAWTSGVITSRRAN